MVMRTRRLFQFAGLCVLLLLGGVQGSQYNDNYEEFGQDSLYHDYAAKQQEKEAAAGGAAVKTWPKYLMGAGAGWLIGSKFHCSRQQKKLNSKHKSDQKALYTQYYNDVYSLQQQNAELVQALEQMGVKMR